MQLGVEAASVGTWLMHTVGVVMRATKPGALTLLPYRLWSTKWTASAGAARGQPAASVTSSK